MLKCIHWIAVTLPVRCVEILESFLKNEPYKNESSSKVIETTYNFPKTLVIFPPSVYNSNVNNAKETQVGKIIVGLIAVFLFFFFGIDIFRKMSGKEKFNLTKWLSYSIACSLLTVLFVATIVVLF